MTDTTASATAVDKRESVAKHELIATGGGEHVSIDTAIGIRYTDRSTNQTFEYFPDGPHGKPGTPLMMLALFGAKTKATNETSRVRNGAGGDTTAQMEALDEVFESITNGVWREKAEGGGGSRTDKGLLATVLIELLGQNAKGDQAHYVKRFEDDVAYMRKVLKSDAGEEYRKRAGKAGPAIDSLA
jgi:hypothetical protein